MADFDPIEYVTKTYKPGSFISHHPWIDPMQPNTAPFDLDSLVVAGVVKKQRRGYYMATVEELAQRCNERLTKIVQRASGCHELRILLPSAPRAYAFDVVADELAYGDTCLTNPHRSDCSSKSHVEHLALIEQCCAEARRRFYDEPGQDGVGEQIRTIRALRACSIGQNPEVYVAASTNDRWPVGGGAGRPLGAAQVEHQNTHTPSQN